MKIIKLKQIAPLPIKHAVSQTMHDGRMRSKVASNIPQNISHIAYVK